MDLRSKNKLDKTANVHHSSSGEEGTHEEASKMANSEGNGQNVDMAFVLREIRLGNQSLSNKIDAQTAEIHESISGLKATLDGLASRVAETEERISLAEDKLAGIDPQLTKLTRENAFLVDKVEALENYSRRNNIRIVNLPEGCEGNDPVTFFTTWLPNTLGKEHFPEPLILERAHRTLGQKPAPGQRPRAVLVRLLKYQDRETILKVAAKVSRTNKTPITFDGEPVMFFPDLSASLVKRRREYDQVKRRLRSAGMDYSLLHPATLRIRLQDGKYKFFKTPKDATAFVDSALEK